jgi:hypothetical protein
LTFEETAQLFDVDERTLYRWCDLGLPRSADGSFSFPMTGLWFQVLKHRHDDRCQRHPEQDLLFLLSRSMRVFPARNRTIGEGQRLLRQLAGFRLEDETIEKIRKT